MATKVNHGGYQQNYNPDTGKYEVSKKNSVNYIPNKRKLDKINELAKKGDIKAKDFLFNFRDLSKKEVSEYLNSIDTGEEDRLTSVIDSLIDDEEEAIEGYKKASEIFKDNIEFTSVFSSIIKDEEEHIEMLNDLKDKLTKEEEK